ncbi:hypothetical protein PR048_024258 [Dryococelus australis]|uniref:Uncharacterized protein n=1 Tax=Dryococelus australis TaxID=614101 RepID=A0ABQ9GN28_9NEOP|nr:hypothetical protein PR048_024258 [Dryococelus australis]
MLFEHEAVERPLHKNMTFASEVPHRYTNTCQVTKSRKLCEIAVRDIWDPSNLVSRQRRAVTLNHYRRSNYFIPQIIPDAAFKRECSAVGAYGTSGRSENEGGAVTERNLASVIEPNPSRLGGVVPQLHYTAAHLWERSGPTATLHRSTSVGEEWSHSYTTPHHLGGRGVVPQLHYTTSPRWERSGPTATLHRSTSVGEEWSHSYTTPQHLGGRGVVPQLHYTTAARWESSGPTATLHHITSVGEEWSHSYTTPQHLGGRGVVPQLHYTTSPRWERSGPTATLHHSTSVGEEWSHSYITPHHLGGRGVVSATLHHITSVGEEGSYNYTTPQHLGGRGVVSQLHYTISPRWERSGPTATLHHITSVGEDWSQLHYTTAPRWERSGPTATLHHITSVGEDWSQLHYTTAPRWERSGPTATLHHITSVGEDWSQLHYTTSPRWEKRGPTTTLHRSTSQRLVMKGVVPCANSININTLLLDNQSTQKGRSFTSIQQPMEKRPQFRYIQYIEVQPHEVRMEQHQHVEAGETGHPRENSPTSSIVRHNSHLRKSGSGPAWDWIGFALVGDEQSNRSATAASYILLTTLFFYMFYADISYRHEIHCERGKTLMVAGLMPGCTFMVGNSIRDRI